MNTKNDIFQKHTEQNQKLSTPMKLQHTQNSLTTQKMRRCIFQRCQN